MRLDFGMRVLIKTLKEKSLPQFRMKWFFVQEIKLSYNQLCLIRENEKLLSDVFGVWGVDRIPYVDFTSKKLQKSYYKDYTCNAEVTNVFVFNFYGGSFTPG